VNEVIISTNERSVFHEQFCPYVNRIAKKYRKQIREDYAIMDGYCECKFCRSVRGIVYKYRKYGYNVFYDAVDDAFCMKTNVGFWKLIWRENIEKWHLFHMNHKGWKSFNPDLPAKTLMRGSFHRQEDFRPTTKVSSAIKYILAHDKNYQLAEEDIRKVPKKTQYQKKRYNQQKKRKKKESIKNVYRIFNTLERNK